MGCTRSKLTKDICLKDEMTEMHVDFIKKNGLDEYYAIMGIESDTGHNSFNNNSSNVNLGLFNIETRMKQTQRFRTQGCQFENMLK